MLVTQILRRLFVLVVTLNDHVKDVNKFLSGDYQIDSVTISDDTAILC